MAWVCLVSFALGGAARAAPAGEFLRYRLPPGPGNPRNSEGAFIQLRDGRVLLIYTHFTGGAADAAAARLSARVSADGGKTWSDRDEDVPTHQGKVNVMSVSLLRLKSGPIALIYLAKESAGDCRAWMQTSNDECATWSKPWLCMEKEGYFVVNNDRVIQLSGGRLLMPAACHSTADKPFVARSFATAIYSDDEGKSWRRSKSELEAPAASKSGLQEPGVVELRDGRVMMLCRTDQGTQFLSYSSDRGETWSAAEASELKSPLSPASIKRIPKTGDLMVVWNDHSRIEAALKGKRTPFAAAISQDDGKSWSPSKLIEADPKGWYCYTAIEFCGDRVLLAHCAGRDEGAGRLATLQITSFNVSWLYE